MSRHQRLLALLVPAILLWPPLREAAEASMFRHMLVVFPALLAAGWFVAGALNARAQAAFARWNGMGLPGLLYVTVVLTIWMIPNALDLATVNWDVDVAKTASLFSAGMVLALSLRQASPVLQTFFVGNWVTMTIFVGVLFQALPTRLCNAYLVGDQVRTGIGMIVLAAAVGSVWAYGIWRRWRASAVVDDGTGVQSS